MKKSAATSDRRRWLAQALALTATSSVLTTASAATPPAPAPATLGPAAPGDEATHKIVYQLNHPEPEYQEAIFNSISALLKKYMDEVSIVVVVWGPGIHLLAKKPQRPVPPILQQRAVSMAQAYGVRFIACGNTMHTVGWTAEDMLDFVTVEEVGAAAVMELQAKGYAYLAW